MDFTSFHNPDISLPVLRRRACEHILEMVVELGRAAMTRGRSLMWKHSFRSEFAYACAVRRLKKGGLLVERSLDGQVLLELTEKGEAHLPKVCNNRYPWQRYWNGNWYVLVYDVPEAKKPYRESLRGFLRRMKMGCLQKSVWVTPRDIRPEFDDLARTVDVKSYAFLFESQNVLGRGAQDIVLRAWNVDRLERTQRWYCEVFSENFTRACRPEATPEDLLTLAHDELPAFLTAMEEDPLLPEALWPQGYRGRQVVDLHWQLVREIAARI